MSDIGVKIGLEGEKEFRKAVSEINTGLRVTASELKLVTAQFSTNAQSIESLTARNEVLNKQYGEQAEKVRKIEEALKNAQETFKEDHKVTQDWQEKLNLANAELFRMKDALDQNSEALGKAREEKEKLGQQEEEVGKQTKTFGGVIGDLAGKLGIKLPEGAEKAIKALDGAKISTADLMKVTASLITGLAKTTIETAKAADEITTLSKVTRLSTDTIQEMNYASEFLDVSAEDMTGSMGKMIRSMGDAQKGTGDAADAFKKLHLRVTDTNGQLKNSEEMFYATIDALGQVKNETERDAIAMEIFGRSARELNPLIEAGSKSLKELGEEAHKMGYVMDEKSLASLNKLKDSMDKFKFQTDAFKNSIAMVMLPVLTALFEFLNKLDPKVVATVAIIGGIAVVAFSVIKSIKNVTDTFKNFDVASMKTTLIVLGVVAALIALAAIIAVLSGKGGEVERTMSSIGSSVNNLNGTVSGVRNTQLAYVNGSHARGLNYVPYDGYVAELHKGERVQTASENPYNGGSGGGDMIVLNVKMSEVDEVYKLINVVKRAKQTRRAGKVVLA